MKKTGLTIVKLFTLCVLGLALTIPGIQTAQAAIQQKAVSINAAADYSSGTHSVISVDPVGGPREIQNDLQATVSDLGLNAYGRYFYVIERFYGDNVTKYDISNPSTPIWQFSTMDENDAVATSNPQNIIFVGPTKAYLLRHNSANAWIINPGTTDEDGFRTGYLDLSAYNDQDEYGPEMTNGILVDNYLFIICQRLNQDDSHSPNTAYMAVIDTTTDQEVDTGMGGDLKGIELPVKNPSAIEYDPETGLIFVQGVGKYANSWSGTPAEYSGGIATINPTTFETTLLIDDGDDENHPYGNISGMTVLSANQGYFIGYAGWGDNTMYEFNPTTGEVIGEANEYLKNKNISGMNAGVSADQNGMVWITNATDAEIVILNPTDNTIDEKISTNLNPNKVVFVAYGESDEDADNNGVADAQEISEDVDLNYDDTIDVINDGYKFLNTYDNGAQIAMEAGENVAAIMEILSIDPATALNDSNGEQPTELPFGLLDFSLSVQPGSQATAVVYLPGTDVTSWYKYSETNGWEDYTDHAVFTTMDNGDTRVELTFQDGGFGDTDGKVNGIIVDPSGPGEIKSSSSGGGGGCFINTLSGSRTSSDSMALFMGGLLLAVMLVTFNRQTRTINKK